MTVSFVASDLLAVRNSSPHCSSSAVGERADTATRAHLPIRAPLPIAGGEVLTRRQAIQPWLEAGAFDIVQPDVTKVGGISDQIQIARMANAFGIRYVGHGWNTAVGLAADLQLSAAIPTADLVEYIGGSPYIDEITEGGWSLDADGMIAIPDKPGLGITLNRDALREVTRDSDRILGA